jgi:hypothetical protein
VDSVANTNIAKYLFKEKTKIILREQITEKRRNTFGKLKEQSTIISHVQEICTIKTLQNWQVVVANLPSNITCFCRKALILSLANASNLRRWGQSDGKCELCGDLQTQLHVFSFCKKALDRYLWRHNSVLNTIVHHLCQIKNEDLKLYVDLPGSGLPHPSEIFSSLVPDLVIALPDKVTVVELTIPFETNTSKARAHKTSKYRNLRSQLRIPCVDFEVIPVEITTLGFFSRDGTKFKNLLKDLGCRVDRVVSKMSEVVIRASFYIYCRRNKTWTNPEYLKYI